MDWKHMMIGLISMGIALVVSATCDPTELHGPNVVSIKVYPESATLSTIGDTLRFRAVVLDQDGRRLAGKVDWSQESASVLSVVESGTVVALARGSGEIRAEFGGVIGTATVIVASSSAGVCGRTPRVRDEITAVAGRSNCADVTDGDLATIRHLDLSGPESSAVTTEQEPQRHALRGASASVLPSPLTPSLHTKQRRAHNTDGKGELIPGKDRRLRNLSEVAMSEDSTGAPIDSLRSGDFDGLVNLLTLRLVRNRLREIPESLGNLSNLTDLWLYNNQLREIPESLGNLSNLTDLWLYNNQLREIPESLGNLSDLRVLDLYNNQLRELPDGFLGSTSLEWLWLDRNPGEPFEFVLELRRDDDDDDPLASGRAEVSPRLAYGALFDLALSLGSVGAVLSTHIGKIASGQVIGDLVKIDKASNDAVAVWIAETPRMPQTMCRGFPCFDGFDFVIGEPLVLQNPRTVRVTTTRAYLTQATQSLDGRVPLVAGRKALLRVFATSNRINAFRPAGRATFVREGDTVYTTALDSLAVGIPTELDESRLTRSLNATIPGFVLQPGVEMTVELDGSGVPLTRNSTIRLPSNGVSTLDIRRIAPQELMLVPVNYVWEINTGVNSVVNDFVNDLGTIDSYGAMRYTRAVLPIADVNVSVRDPYLTWADTALTGDVGLLSEIELLRHIESGGDHEWWHGVFGWPRFGRVPAWGRFSGIAFLPGRSALSLAYRDEDRPYAGFAETFAHEWGHNLSLSHTPCGGPAGVDPDYPYEDAVLGVWGYDFGNDDGNRGRLLDPEGVFRDHMSYCGPEWTSDYSYMKALDYLGQNGASSLPRIAQRTLILWGGARDGKLRVEPPFLWDAPIKLPVQNGPYRIVGFDVGGSQLFAFDFSPVEIDHGGNGFLFAIPVNSERIGNLAAVTLSGPEGTATVEREAISRLAIFTDRVTGQIRSIARNWDGILPMSIDGLRLRVETGLEQREQ